jgi:signal peptidase I
MARAQFEAPTIRNASERGQLGPALCTLVREGLSRQGHVCVRLQGDSMWPTVPSGSLVAIERAEPGKTRLGEIVVWEQDGTLIAHRVVQRARDGEGRWLVTKGDNCSAADQRLAPSEVLGRISAVQVGDGRVVPQDDRLRSLESAFWVARWRVRRLAGASGRRLPTNVRRYLAQLRNWMGRCLSLGFRHTLLRY